MSDILAGKIRRLPPWPRVEAMVEACLHHARQDGRTVPPDLGDIKSWKSRYRDAEDYLEPLKHRADRSGARPASVTAVAGGPVAGEAASRAHTEAYLTKLTEWLNVDSWPRDRRFGSSESAGLSPATIERVLRVAVDGGKETDAGEIDADELARWCRRLVLLGDPGSGKTWLAKRIARQCAQQALRDLRQGMPLGQVELPLFTTCSRLLRAQGHIRDAIVASAFDQLGDLGGSDVSAAVRSLFTKSACPPVLLVIDSLDEAPGSDDRLRQAGSLPWRIVLTTRPGSWNHQLAVEENNDAHCLGSLRPLRYPDDVEPFIRTWFGGHPERGQDLVAQIARRPELQQAATVPLILAMYCVVAADGGRRQLPQFRHELFRLVLNRMLTGSWRSRGSELPDHREECLLQLREWAWASALSHEVSGIGTWDDLFRVERRRRPPAVQRALDHIAPVTGPGHVDGPEPDKEQRRFIHRSVREHLVAEYVAGLPVADAARLLLPHLWYDQDWADCAPAAIAMNPQHDELLRQLASLAALAGQPHGDLPVIDARWEFPRLLARLATESRPGDWSERNRAMIGAARVGLVRSGQLNAVAGAPCWPDSDRQALDVLLQAIPPAAPGEPWHDHVHELIHAASQMAPGAAGRSHAISGLLHLLNDSTTSDGEHLLVEGIVRLVTEPPAPAAADRHRDREFLLAIMARHPGTARLVTHGLVRLAVDKDERRQEYGTLMSQLRASAHDNVHDLIGWLLWLAPTAEDRIAIRAVLTGRLCRLTESGQLTDEEVEHAANLLSCIHRATGEIVTGETPAAGEPDMTRIQAAVLRLLTALRDRRREARDALLGFMTVPAAADAPAAAGLPPGEILLEPTASSTRLAWEALTRLRQTSKDLDFARAGHQAIDMLHVGATEADHARARPVLLGWLSMLADRSDYWAAIRLAEAVSGLKPTAQQKRDARKVLLRMLTELTTVPGPASRTVIRQDPHAVLWTRHPPSNRAVPGIGDILNPLLHLEDPPGKDTDQVRGMLLALLDRGPASSSATSLAQQVLRLHPTAADKRRVLDVLLHCLTTQERFPNLAGLADTITQLGPTAEDKRKAMDRYRWLLEREMDAPGQSDPRDTETTAAGSLIDAMAQLAATSAETRQLRDDILQSMARHPRGRWLGSAPWYAAQLTADAPGRHRLRLALLEFLDQHPESEATRLIPGVLKDLVTDKGSEPQRQVRDAFLKALAAQTDGITAVCLANDLTYLHPAAADKRQALDRLHDLPAGISGEKTLQWTISNLPDRITRLDPVTRDVETWYAEGIDVNPAVLAAVRRNSKPEDWLALLRRLESLPR